MEKEKLSKEPRLSLQEQVMEDIHDAEFLNIISPLTLEEWNNEIIVWEIMSL
jgi:hypothetical protein